MRFRGPLRVFKLGIILEPLHTNSTGGIARSRAIELYRHYGTFGRNEVDGILKGKKEGRALADIEREPKQSTTKNNGAHLQVQSTAWGLLRSERLHVRTTLKKDHESKSEAVLIS